MMLKLGIILLILEIKTAAVSIYLSIYLSQSYYGTDRAIRLNCTHHCTFEFPSRNEQNMICRELGINKFHYQRATQEPYDFIYDDKPKKRVAKNFNDIILYKYI